ncbi:hypothetical protein SCHPADRAFT_888274 [Schizopora paradoxa]|uniref:Uncharacterized protein n=1 Tax=Schizopora paradoxa TaxID=27342 RepID=A0A0H2S1Q4_9AGAM|nr:hypothetical protein SCHPADRAFT_888274 [Schizopora paradoxa]
MQQPDDKVIANTNLSVSANAVLETTPTVTGNEATKNAHPCATCKRMHRKVLQPQLRRIFFEFHFKCHGGYPCVGCQHARDETHRHFCRPTYKSQPMFVLEYSYFTDFDNNLPNWQTGTSFE